MNGCKIDHNDPEALPAFLCLTCNPRSPEASQRADEAIRARDAAASLRATKQRELLKAKQALTRAERAKTNRGIEFRKAESLRAKIAALEAELRGVAE